MIRPSRLREGDTVAVLSMSWGGPAVFPDVFEAGCAVLSERFGLRVREYPTTRALTGTEATTPRARAADLHAAFADDSVAAIIASIGGDDSALLLPHWQDRILFLETSEDRPTVEQLRYWLFNLGVQGVFDRAAGLLIGRARGYSDATLHTIYRSFGDVRPANEVLALIAVAEREAER